MSAIQADYRTNKHIPSRKCYQLIMEVAEEDFPLVCKTLGYPATGENTYVAIALLDTKVTKKDEIAVHSDSQQTEGDKLRVRAVLLCKDSQFQDFYWNNVWMGSNTIEKSENGAKKVIYGMCDISSRSELATNPEAQIKFKELLAKFDAWKIEQQYPDNLSRF